MPTFLSAFAFINQGLFLGSYPSGSSLPEPSTILPSTKPIYASIAPILSEYFFSFGSNSPSQVSSAYFKLSAVSATTFFLFSNQKSIYSVKPLALDFNDDSTCITLFSLVSI